MDRLICGDVGFGKTEVALRAAFIDRDERQAGRGGGADHAARAPAHQDLHRTLPRLSGEGRPGVAAGFRGRLEAGQEGARRRHARHRRSAPMRCSARASSSRTSASSSSTRSSTSAWRTRRSSSSLRAEVHVLTLTATPIPRTLQLALTGVRDLSIIASPPVDRLAVRTFVVAVRSADRARGAAARALSRRPVVLCLPAHRGSRGRQGFPRQERAGGAGRGRARPDAVDGARRHHVGVLRRQIRRAALDHDHRIRPRHPDRQHADRASRRHVRPGAALPVARPGRALEAARLCAVHAAGEAQDHGAGRAAAEGAAIARYARRRLPACLARSRHPRRRQSARATSSPATSRKSASSSTSRCWKRRW